MNTQGGEPNGSPGPRSCLVLWSVTFNRNEAREYGGGVGEAIHRSHLHVRGHPGGDGEMERRSRCIHQMPCRLPAFALYFPGAPPPVPSLPSPPREAQVGAAARN